MGFDLGIERRPAADVMYIPTSPLPGAAPELLDASPQIKKIGALLKNYGFQLIDRQGNPVEVDSLQLSSHELGVLIDNLQKAGAIGALRGSEVPRRIPLDVVRNHRFSAGQLLSGINPEEDSVEIAGQNSSPAGLAGASRVAASPPTTRGAQAGRVGVDVTSLPAFKSVVEVLRRTP